MRGQAGHPVCGRAPVGWREGIRVAPGERLRSHTPLCSPSRFRDRPVVFPLRRVGSKNRCTRDFRTEVSRARYFNPQIGRFWTMDSFEGIEEDPLSLHKYSYCGANPINGADPSGFGENLGTLTVAGGGMTILAGLQMPAFSAAMVKATIVTLAGAAAVAVTVTSDEGENKNRAPNAMAVQLQEGSSLAGGKHYWSMPLIELKRNAGVTKLQVQTALGAMWLFYKKPDGEPLPSDWDKFNFSKNKYMLSAAIVKMSAWVKSSAPVSMVGTVHTEYLYPTDTDGARIDLANYRGTHLRQ